MKLRPQAAGPLLLLLVTSLECAIGDQLSAPQPVHVWRHTIPAAGRISYGHFYTQGTYDFGYDTGGGEHQSFRQESRNANGLVTGLYGYVEEDGSLRVVQYEADDKGYRWSTAQYRLVASVPVVRQPSQTPTATRRRPQPLIVGPIPAPPPSR